MKNFLWILIFLLVNSAVADVHHSGKLSSINLGLRYSSLLQNRGVILYKDFQIDPVVAVFLFDDRLEFLGDSIGYRDFLYSDRLRLRTRIISLTDKPLFPKNGAIYAASTHRKDTYEWSNQLELFLPGYNKDYGAELDFSFNKDFSGHHGNYLEFQSKVKLFSFKTPLFQTEIEPNIVSSLGWGDGKHNQYYYGPSATGPGFNNIAYGIWFAFPEEADRFYPIVQVKHFQTIGRNRDAEFAKGKNSGWLASFIASVGILE